MNVGVVFASTGGNKIVRAVRSFQRMEPGLPVQVNIAINTNTYRHLNRHHELQLLGLGVKVCHVQPQGFVNGGMNAAVASMQRLGCDYACVLHDDLVFSHLPEHRHAISKWFDSEYLEKSSGLSFSHFEALVPDPGADLRRHPQDWDKEDLESDELWRFLSTVQIAQNVDICPPGASYFFRYEGPDVVRMWNRLGPTCLIVPISTWERLDRFSETNGIYYDDEYATECFLRGLPPIYAVTNFPFIHLHNQSVNPWTDPAQGPWGDTVGSYIRRYGTNKVGVWKDDWEERWREVQRIQSACV